MHPFSLSAFDDSSILLDEEFDRTDANMAPQFGTSPGDELAWDDQLDNGEAMSL